MRITWSSQAFLGFGMDVKRCSHGGSGWKESTAFSNIVVLVLLWSQDVSKVPQTRWSSGTIQDSALIRS